MKFAWKIFFTACALLVFSLGLGSFLLVNASFQNTLSARRASALEKADSLRLSYQALLAADQVLSTNLAYHYGLEGGQAQVPESNPFPAGLEPGQQGSRLMAGPEGEVTFQVVLPLETPDGRLLYLETREDFSDIYQMRRRSLAASCLVMVGVCLVSGGLLFWFSRRLTRPLGRLAKAAAILGEGDYSRRAPEDSSTLETAALAQVFNRMADQVESQMAELKEEARRRDEFVANFTHELKTPLTSIIGYADLMRTYELEPPRRREYSDFIYREGTRLESLSLHLMELIVLGKAEAPTAQVPAKALLEGARRSLLPLLEREKIQLFVEWEAALLRADPQLIQTLLYNLADNARKAMDGPLRQILIQGRLTPEGYRVTVADTGRGIPADQLSRITEPFYMVDKSRARSQGGAGLGLALCQRIALLHGSKLEFLSRPGEGTAVSFTLPLAGESRPEARSAAPHPAGPAGMGSAESAAPSDPSRPGPRADAQPSPQPAPHDSFREVNP